MPRGCGAEEAVAEDRGLGGDLGLVNFGVEWVLYDLMGFFLFFLSPGYNMFGMGV